MPIKRTFSIDKNLAIVRYFGYVDTPQIIEHVNKFRDMLAGHKAVDTLLMYAENTDFSEIRGEELSNLARISPMLRTDANHVVVAADALYFGISRMFTSYSPPGASKINIVRSLEEALEILNLDAAEFAKIDNYGD